jgi:two-component system nitrogen regulation sensor histidine kinase NtrY
LKLPCDRRQISQALTNLLQNAADAIAMREGGEAGRIETRITVEGGALSFQVTDNGVGLPKAEPRERLTEPYVTHKPKGTGLGLAIVKKIMEDHGGSIILEDRPHGPGTLARLVLPLGESPWQSVEPAAKAAQAAN